MIFFFSLAYLFDRDPRTGETGANSQLKDKLLGCIKLKTGKRFSCILLLCWDSTRTKSLLFTRDTFEACRAHLVMLLIPLLSHKTAVSSIASASTLSKCAISGQNRSFSIFKPVAIIYFDFQKDFVLHIHKRPLRILG